MLSWHHPKSPIRSRYNRIISLQGTGDAPLLTGRTIGHYTVMEKLGSGGMGVVYKALDVKLDRIVAIKFLPAARVADHKLKQRFVQEAKAASALNHPNIITIYDIEYEEGVDFIAMEYVRGKSLDQLISRSGMRLEETLKYAIQIADGLAAAHDAGILHRDLKPANVMVSDSGLIKVLDFGVAKLVKQWSTGAEDPTRPLPVNTGLATEDGVILGTAPYMSPEQVEAQNVDARSDIFSFGSLLYEMVTARQAFRGKSQVATMSAILREEPTPPSEIVANIPRDLERIVVRCMRKDPSRRFQHMADLRVALEEVREESGTGKAVLAHSLRRRRRWKRVSVFAVAVVLLAACILWWRRTATSKKTTATGVETPIHEEPLTTYAGWESYPTFSPDGSQIAFAWGDEEYGNSDIYVQVVGSANPVKLTKDPARDTGPIWSPDGKWIAFFREVKDVREVRIIGPLGGPERKVTTVRGPTDAAWTPDSRWLIVSDRASMNEPNALFLVSREGEDRRRLTKPTGNIAGDINPAISPDGRMLAFRRRVPLVVPLNADYTLQGEPRAVFTPRRDVAPVDMFGLAWSPNGSGLIVSGTTVNAEYGLWRVPIDGSMKPTALPFARPGGPTFAISRPDRSGTAKVAYAQGVLDSDIWRLNTATSQNKKNLPERFIHSTKLDTGPQYSPDGTKIAFASTRTGKFEIWTCKADGTEVFPLTSMGTYSATPRWSPDGQWIAFDHRQDQWDVYKIKADGSEKPIRLTTHAALDAIPSWSRDGKWIYFTSDRLGGSQIWRMPAGGGEAVQVTKSGGTVAQESADGKLVYYMKESRIHSSLWSISVDSGEEKEVLKSVGWRAFAPTNKGIWFLALDGSDDIVRLYFHDFASRQQRAFITVKMPGVGLAAAPDGQSVLYTEREQAGSDLMLVENFR